jgi:hypothetical protein
MKAEVINYSKPSLFCEISFCMKSMKSTLSSSKYEEELVKDAYSAGDGARLGDGFGESKGRGCEQRSWYTQMEVGLDG